jgi:4-alpha-glucanotransferase
MQDLLNLGISARMNDPGNPSGNWTWRMPETAMNDDLSQSIRELTYLYSRESK